MANKKRRARRRLTRDENGVVGRLQRPKVIGLASAHIYGSGPVGKSVAFMPYVLAGYLGALCGHGTINLVYNICGWAPPITSPLFFPPIYVQDTILTLIWYGIPLALGLAICLALHRFYNSRRWRLTIPMGLVSCVTAPTLFLTGSNMGVILTSVGVSTILIALAIISDRHGGWTRDPYTRSCPPPAQAATPTHSPGNDSPPEGLP